jgi:hypothetical protein
MLFQVEHDPEDVVFIVKSCMQSGMPLPDFIKNEPELMPGLEIFLQAFWDLSTCRQMGMGLGPIPWTSVQEYCTINGGSEEFNRDMHFHIRQLDAAYLAWCSDKNKESAK